MQLLAGDCELENQDEYGPYETSTLTNESSDSSAQESVMLEDSFNHIIDAEENTSNTSTLKVTAPVPWQSLIDGNSSDKEVTESSRSMSAKPTEIFEPILSDRRLAINHGRKLENKMLQEEVMEPVLKSTTPRQNKSKDIGLPAISTVTTESAPQLFNPVHFTASTQKPRGSAQSVEIHLFPFRLGELLQQAERYARETILPLISSEAPKLFGFNNAEADESAKESRKPRYIPRYEQLQFLNAESYKINGKNKPRYYENIPNNPMPREQKDQRNIFSLLHSHKNNGQQNKHVVPYYTNLMFSESRALIPDNPDNEPIFIELPTYRPPRNGK